MCQEVPYDELDTNDLLVAIEQGYRLHCPEGCPDHVYQDIMACCWSLEPHDRATFSQLTANLQRLLATLPQDDARTPRKPQSFRSKKNMYENYPSRYADNGGQNGAHRQPYENVELQPEPRKGSILLQSSCLN